MVTGRYPAASGVGDLVVAKRGSRLTWTTPAPIIYGTPLEPGQLNAVPEVPGALVYSPAAGTVLSVGEAQTLSVIFTPTDSVNYLPARATTTLTVIDSSAGVCVAPPGGPQGLVSWWSGEGDGIDRMGRNPATLQGGVTFAPGRVGQGFSFPAPGGVVTAPSPSLDLTRLTIEAWVSFDSLPSGFGTIVTKQDDPGYINYSLFVTSSGNLAFYWVDPAGTHSVVSSGVGMMAGVFHHVAVTVDGTRVRFYVDGVLAWDAPQETPLVPVPDGPLVIGTEFVSDQFYGVIDELAIYDHALSSGEVRDIYLAGTLGKCPPPSVLDVSPVVVELGGTRDFRAALTSNAVPLAGQTVTFSLNGTDVGAPVTDANGVATLAGVSLAGIVPGTYPGAVGARFAGNATYSPVAAAASLTVVDTTAPVVSILSPTNGSVYVTGQAAAASYECVDPSGVASCRGPVPSGRSIDTSTPGVHDFAVTAIDAFGNTSAASVSYTVIDLPRITVVSPTRPIYDLGSALVAQYTCDGAGSVTCQGDVLSGAALDTSTPGLKTFRITATDAYGNTAFQDVSYSVSLGSCVMPFSGMTAWLPGDGSSTDELSGAQAAWIGTEAYVSGQVGQAFAFDGNSSVSVPFTQAGTIQAWVRTSNRLQPAGTGVISMGGAQIELDGYGNYQLSMGSSDLVLFIGPATADFQHIAVTTDGSSIWTYLNGQLTDVQSTWPGLPGLTGGDLIVGADRSGLLRFTGAVDELQTFDRDLTSDEVMQTFLTGSAGLCKDHAPVAAATATPNPAEATGSDGATVLLDGTSSSDLDGDVLTYTWREGATTLGTGSTLSVLLPIGSHAIALDVNDGRHKSASTTVLVVVQDTVAPNLVGVSTDLTVEATGPAGAVVTWTPPTAVDVVDGPLAVACTPDAGAIFSLAATVVTCSATDAHANRAAHAFTVTVRDTTSPTIHVDAPVANATYLLNEAVAAAFACADTVGVASCVGPVPSGSAIDTTTRGPHTFTVTGIDTSGNATPAVIRYTVVGPPVITVTSPVLPIYERGSTLVARYSCEFATTCGGDIANGEALDTSTDGYHSFAVNATDDLGNTTSQVVTYAVSAGTSVTPFPDLLAWLGGDNSTFDEVTGADATWTGTAAYAAGEVGQGFAVSPGNSVSLPVAQSGAFTVQAWVRVANPLQPAGTGILSTGGPGQEPTSLEIGLDGAGNYQVTVGNHDLVLFLGPAADYFQHLAVTSDGSTMTTYLNGQPTDIEPWTGASAPGIYALTLGLDRAGLAPATAVVDEAQVFGRSLTADEVYQAFLAGASGLRKDQPPVAVATATPVEATGPAGVAVLLDGTGSSDPDGDPLTYTWRAGTTILGSGATLTPVVPVGLPVTLTVDDGRHKTATSNLGVLVRDTTAPDFSNVPGNQLLQATGPAGASASWTDPTATDLVDGPVAAQCVPASGSTFAVGDRVVTCSATDAHANTGTATFHVVVRDTTPPVLSGVPSIVTAEATGPSSSRVDSAVEQYLDHQQSQRQLELRPHRLAGRHLPSVCGRRCADQ